MSMLFGDWSANANNPKGRIIAIAFRIANFAHGKSLFIKYLFFPYLLIYRVIFEWVLGVEIPWKTSIGRDLVIFHGQSLVINDSAVIGKGCILRHCTTIGVSATDLTFKGLAPVIGDFVDIGSNVVIVGGIKIGDYAKIGAGSVVVSDVPSYATVVGNPARIVSAANGLQKT